MRVLTLLVGLVFATVAPLAAQRGERSFVDFSRPEFSISAGLTFYEEELGPEVSPGLGGGTSLFAGSYVCLDTGGVDFIEADVMGGGFGFGGGYASSGGWPWDDPPTGSPGGPAPAGGGGAQQALLALSHGSAFYGQLLIRPTWLMPGLQGERLRWNVVGGVGLHRQNDGDPSTNVNGIPAWGIEGQTNLMFNLAVTTDWTLTDALAVRAMARMNWLRRDDPVFIQPGGGTVVNTDADGLLTWGAINVGLTFRPGG